MAVASDSLSQTADTYTRHDAAPRRPAGALLRFLWSRRAVNRTEIMRKDTLKHDSWSCGVIERTKLP